MVRQLLILCAFFFVTNGAVAGEVDMRRALMAEVNFHLSRDSFSDLERLHSALLSSDERFPSGVWKLFFFHLEIRRYLRDDADPSYWASLEEKAESWRKAFPNSVAAPIFLAEIHLQRAWTYRGEGYASTVRDWDKVKAYAAKAHTALVQGGPAVRSNPEWYSVMFRVLDLYRSEPGEFQTLLQEGMTKHPNYHGLYFSASRSLQPKWGGSEEAIEALASEGTARSSKTEGKAMYARVYWNLDQSVYEGTIFKRSKADWVKMRAGFEDIVAKSPEAWNINSYAYFACLAGDKATLAKLLGRIGGSADFGAWGPRKKLFYDECVDSLQRTAPEPRQSTPIG
jgi:hypothetical protein